MRNTTIINRISGSRELPSLTSTGHKLMQMISDPNTTMQRIAAVVAMDPPLAAGVMRIANGAASGFTERTHDLGHAITRIGLRMLKTLVVTTSVLRPADPVRNAAVMDRQGFWQYSLATAIAARQVAHRHKPLHGDDAFLSGLLHCVGLTVLDVFFPEQMAASMLRMSRERLSLREAIMSETSVGLGMIGGLMLREWEIDENICATVAVIDGSAEAPEPLVRQLADYVRVGASLARAAAIGRPLDFGSNAGAALSSQARLLHDAMKRCRIEPEDLTLLVDKVRAEYSIFEDLARDKAA